MLLGSNGNGSDYAAARKLLVLGAIGFLAAPVIAAVGRRLLERKELAKADARIDKNLKDTFPASDPSGPHFVDIPVNRR